MLLTKYADLVHSLALQVVRKNLCFVCFAGPAGPSSEPRARCLVVDATRRTLRSHTGMDVRLLHIRYSEAGERERKWREVSQAVAESEMSDFPISGPRTAAWVTRFFTCRGAGAEEHHRWWRSTARLSGSE